VTPQIGTPQTTGVALALVVVNDTHFRKIDYFPIRNVQPATDVNVFKVQKVALVESSHSIECSAAHKERGPHYPIHMFSPIVARVTHHMVSKGRRIWP